jgi:hypothetical protein
MAKILRDVALRKASLMAMWKAIQVEYLLKEVSC